MASNKPIVPKDEILDFRLPSDAMFSRHIGDSGASSSGSKIRLFFIDMGFMPSLVDKVIEEKGEDDVNLLFETLTAYSAGKKLSSDSSDSPADFLSGKKGTNPPKFTSDCYMEGVQTSKSESSDSLESLFNDMDVSSEIPSVVIPKEEADEHCGSKESKRASLLLMKFTVNEVDFAIDKLGGDALVNELVDFIIAAQIAENVQKETDCTLYSNELKKEVQANEETLYVTMEKTLRLLEMGFSEDEVSLAIEKFGSDIQISDLADSIVTGRIAHDPGKEEFYPSAFRCDGLLNIPSEVKAEESSPPEAAPLSYGKRPKEEQMDDLLDPIPPFDVGCKGKRPKLEYATYGSVWAEEKVDMHPRPLPPKLNPSKTLDRMVVKHPFFLYGNVLDVPRDSWEMISKFLYAIEPEFVDTRSFSALRRTEGYVHNLPADNRFHILSKPAMTIEDVIPHTKKWWPSWDMRKQLSCINSEPTGVSQLCDRLTKMLTDSRGHLSSQQQRDVLHHCIALNLMWVGQFKLAPIEPHHLERILGYPINHTRDAETTLTERLQSLKYCFQTDTLGYYLSVLKPLYPEGLTVLSIFSGIGGVELALHRLGIPLKVVISVECSGAKRRMMQKWWQDSGQTGKLEQIEDIHKLTSNRILSLITKFSGFDLITCQNPCSPSKMCAANEGIASFDFSIFYEFVRVLQSVRSSM